MTVVDAVATEIDRAFLTDWTARFLRAWNALDAPPAARLVEGLCGHVLLEHPHVQAALRGALDHSLSSRRHEPRAEPRPLPRHRHVDVVDQSSPRGVVVEDHVNEAEQRSSLLGEYRRGAATLGLLQASTPLVAPIGFHFAVEEGVGICAAVVTPPAFGVQAGDARRVRATGAAKLMAGSADHVRAG